MSAVYLIGAGPGDPGLLTLRGKALLERADVIVYDYLASDALLAHARPDAERVYVGKKAGLHALPQEEINRLLVAKAREGKTVARLKGGDPYIFGRGGEEAEALIDAGIPFEEVPGVTSTIAGPAYAGIPLTHRDFASSVTLITGHERPDKPGSVHNWEALAASANTLVFVMGMKNLPDISANLIRAGLAPDTPAALVHWGTTARHRSLVSTLEKLPAEATAKGFVNPSVIIVGRVALLHDRLNWFERRNRPAAWPAGWRNWGPKSSSSPPSKSPPCRSMPKLTRPPANWKPGTGSSSLPPTAWTRSGNALPPSGGTAAPSAARGWPPLVRPRPRRLRRGASGPTLCPNRMWPKAWPRACAARTRCAAGGCSFPGRGRPGTFCPKP